MTFTNGIMELELVTHIGRIAVFYNINTHTYMIGNGCKFNCIENTVTWNWGHYDMTEEQAMECANRLFRD